MRFHVRNAQECFQQADQCRTHIATLQKFSSNETKGAFNKRMVDIVTQPSNSDTPETTSDNGAKPDEPQNPSNN